MTRGLLDNLDIFYGELTPARATVYARLERLENAEGLSLSGFVRGPRCFYSTTLLSTYPLADAGPGPSLLAKALVTDPCYWSPETPNIYDVTIELRRGKDIIVSDVRQIGFKPLGISGRFFTWEGKPWVLRGVTNRTVNVDEVATWTERSTSIVFLNPSTDEQLQQSTARGVLAWVLVPLFGARPKVLLRELSRLSRWPSVAGFLFASKKALDPIDPSYLDIAPNVLKGIPLGNSVSVTPSQRHSTFYWDMRRQNEASDLELTSCNAPTIIIREQGTNASFNNRQFISIEIARRAADKLQADLAPHGQFAGYIV